MDVLTRIRELLAPPVFEADEETRRASLLYVMTLASMAIGIGSGIPAIFMAGTSLAPLLATGAGLLVPLVVLFLLRRRHIRLAGMFLCMGFWVTITLSSYISRGTASPILGGYGVVVLGAGLLLGVRTGAGFAGLSIASIVTLYYFQEQAVLPRFNTLTPVAELLTQISYLASIAVLLYLAMRSLGKTLERARSGERAQIEANRDQIALRASLEDRVAELERAEKSLRDSERLYPVTE